ncbi:unnamed protein product [Bemisia tabaci]|uniref:Uncharacterized protein n=1 Tax=Bemisia tabaci TaxID=7038 RepID=A0A9P0A9B1_BEMTA|nr:unnamed protein product [Bemisia tabaci]
MRSLGRSNIFILCFARFVICAHGSLASLTNSAINVTLKESDQNITDGINPTLEEPMKLKEETPRVDIKEVFRSVCARQVDVLCIKLSLILLVDRLASRPSSVEIYPGVSIQQGHPNSTATTPGRFLVKTAVDSPEALDEVVLSSIHDYLRSLSLNIHILDNNQLRKPWEEQRLRRRGDGRPHNRGLHAGPCAERPGRDGRQGHDDGPDGHDDGPDLLAQGPRRRRWGWRERRREKLPLRGDRPPLLLQGADPLGRVPDRPGGNLPRARTWSRSRFRAQPDRESKRRGLPAELSTFGMGRPSGATFQNPA